MKKLSILIIVVLFTTKIFPQIQIIPPHAQIVSRIYVADGRSSLIKLWFGIDPEATDSLDESLGESFLPPFPPAGALEARFYFPKGNFSGIEPSYSDFRHGSSPFTGQVEHRIAYQRGEGDSVIFYWSMPQGITARLQDLILGTFVDVALSDSGSYAVTNPDIINQLKLIVTYSNVTDVDKEIQSVDKFKLLQNYPNPFNPSTRIQYTLQGVNQLVNLKVYNVLGKEVGTLVNEEQSAGSYEVVFNASGLTSGIYFYKLNAGKFTETKSMILIK